MREREGKTERKIKRQRERQRERKTERETERERRNTVINSLYYSDCLILGFYFPCRSETF